MENLLKKCSAEFLGAFLIVFAGCGSIAVSEINAGALGNFGVATAFGLSVMTMIYALGHISGAHFNPAVSIAFAFTRHFPKRELFPYISAQLLGALSASFLTKVLFQELSPSVQLGVCEAMNDSFLLAMILEFILTFFLMLVIMSVATDYRAVSSTAGWAIGGSVWLLALVFGPIQSASMNPARSIAPAVASGNYHHLLAYIVGPILGALAGSFTYKSIRCEVDDKKQIKGCC